MKYLLTQLKTSIIATLSLAVLLCGLYPLVVWGVAQVAFPDKANGSLIERKGQVVGSSLIAQNFASAKYFHPRPSAAGDAGYDATSSGGSNLGPTSRKLIETIAKRVADYRTENGLAPDAVVPADAITASGSGLDPHISIKNAQLQANRVARSRGIREDAVHKLVASHTEGRDLGIFGEPRVNVMELNLALDAVK